MDRAEQLVTLSGVAADQWGLVTAAQAKALGLSAVQLLRLTEAGLLESVGRGVYALPAAGLPQFLEIKVAWLRLQPRVPAWERPLGDRDSGVVSHASACRLHGLGDIPAPGAEISVPRRRTTTEPFVRLRTTRLESADITVADGLPVTTVMRTIVDLLHAKADGGHVGGVIADAERRDLVDVDALAAAVQPYARKYGLAASATGEDLVEHLVSQAGRMLHAQEVARAGKEGLAVGAEIGALDRDTAVLANYLQSEALAAEVLKPYLQAEAHAAEVLKPYLGQAAVAQALAPLLDNIAAQQASIRAALNDTMPRLPAGNSALRAFRELHHSPALTRALKNTTASSELAELNARLRQSALSPGQLLPAVQALELNVPSVLSPETQEALRTAAASGPAMARAVRALQHLETASTDSANEPGENDTPELPDRGR
ncbi:type IV toxin-antitoxin system AbiEi family antitoxin domain-containing protein [Streptomyces sp. NPDC005774]|uniref:type IV toxin-antitoxin system AbiEi family antitoxin domain-containing protein n=1 Tax=Streptomyces sp. NPDC005774 TaxID=3364728 RepID=UPI0036CA4D7E